MDVLIDGVRYIQAPVVLQSETLDAARAADKAEIDRLTAELESTKAALNAEWFEHGDCRQRVEKVEARIAELEAVQDDSVKRDAKRWRYLRDSGDDSIYAMRFDLDGDVTISGNDLDASIDAVIANIKETTK